MKIIAQSPIVKPCPATSRGCIVIRENDKEYVVHNAEADEDGKLTSFYWGNYFPKRGEPKALESAMLCFVRKMLQFYALNPRYEPTAIPEDK